MAKICKGCGNKIPRKIPHSDKKQIKLDNIVLIARLVSHPKIIILRNISQSAVREKEALVKMLGGHCTKCGYHKSIGALSFHHKNPKKKSFDISNNGNLMQDWEKVVREAKKCELLCLNCHTELHQRK